MSSKSASPATDLEQSANASDTTSSQADSISETDLIFSTKNPDETITHEERRNSTLVINHIDNDASCSKKRFKKKRKKNTLTLNGSGDDSIDVARLNLDDDEDEEEEEEEEEENFYESNEKPDADAEFPEFKLQPKELDENEPKHSQNEAVSASVQEEQLAEDEESSDVPTESNDAWRTKSKHVFVLSEAGKPIYTLHGNEVQLITFMGLMQALVSIIECDNENKLNYVLAGDHKIVFLHKSHLIFVCVSSERDTCVEQLELELTYVYNQILSVVTLSLIEKVFAKYNNYDLRNKLTGTEKLLSNIITRFDSDFGMLLNCVNSYPLQFEVRDQIARIIAQQISPFRYVLFGLLLFDNRLVALIRPKTKNIHPVDVHLIVNVVTGLDTPKSAEFTWYPICLPNFNSSGMMYAYISHLDEQCKTCLILLTGLCDEDQSFELNECRKRIQQKLQTQSINQILNMKYTDSTLRLEQIGVPELKHFLFKDNKIFQYFVSEYALPYAASLAEKRRVFNIYQKLYHKLHNSTNNIKIIYIQQKYETVLGWMTSSFEIYATFSSLITKNNAVNAVSKLLEFTQKNKTKIFLSSMPTIQR